jgi:multiple sugar transport system substrate-binding protein
MREFSKRTFGRRDFVRLGAAAGGLSLLAACGPTAAPPAPTAPPAPAAAKPTEAPKPTAASQAAATGQVTTLKLLGWNYEPPLVQENLDRFEQQNPTYKVDYEPIAGDYLVDLLTRFRAKTPMDVIYVRDQYHASWVESGFLQPLDETDEINALYADMFPYNANQMQWKGKKYGLPYYTDFDVFAYNEKMVNDAGFSAPPATLDELRKQAEAMKQKNISESPLYVDLSKGSDQMWDLWMYTFAS